MQLNWVYLCGAMPDDATESGYTQLEAATINHLHAPVTALMFGCSGTQIYDPEVRDGCQPWDNDRASWSSVLPRTRTRASRAKGKSLTVRPPLSLAQFTRNYSWKINPKRYAQITKITIITGHITLVAGGLTISMLKICNANCLKS